MTYDLKTYFSEILEEDSDFPEKQRQLAALVVSKVYYHLGAFDVSLTYALKAGPLFDLSQRNEYVETTLSTFYLDKLFHFYK